MAVPKKKMSKSQRDQRRAHDHLTFTAAVEECANCGESKLRHHVSSHCGVYKGVQVTAPSE